MLVLNRQLLKLIFVCFAFVVPNVILADLKSFYIPLLEVLHSAIPIKEKNQICVISIRMCLMISGSIVDTLNINIIDINDVTPSCEKQLYSFGIPENTTVESTIITLICTDGDNDPIGINNAIGNYFITEGNTGQHNVLKR